jgi:hypothetical protein
MEVVDVISVLDGYVATARLVRMGMVLMDLMSDCHKRQLSI